VDAVSYSRSRIGQKTLSGIHVLSGKNGLKHPCGQTEKIEAAGLVTRRAYRQHPVRYEYLLTKKGKGLEPVLEAIIVWGRKQYPGTKRFPRVEHR
jgi:hypothetical protein